jgi:hypothetical protein
MKEGTLILLQLLWKPPPRPVRNLEQCSTQVSSMMSTRVEKEVLIFPIDKHGALGFLSDLLSPEGPHESTHSFVPRSPRTRKKAHDISLLESKGALTLPTKQVCDRLILVFFHHVYPFLPVVDANAFLRHYAQHGCNNMSLLLLWSMFLAAANVRMPIAVATVTS